jgi:sirohydrochlorin ferrochelatase
MRAILLIDHGSVRPEANHMLECMTQLLQTMVGPSVLVRCAHMELAEPTIAQGVAACVEGGAHEIVAFPYMLSPGKHSTRDIPRMVSEAASAYPQLTIRVTPAFGIHSKLAEVIAARAGVELTTPSIDAGDQCWHPDAAAGACGEACCARVLGIGA